MFIQKSDKYYELISKIRNYANRVAKSQRLIYIITGYPGVGKGTHVQWLSKDLNLFPISTGDIIRRKIKKPKEQSSSFELQIIDKMNKGEYITDDLVIKMVEDELKNIPGSLGILFDGFPRTLNQAKALTELLRKYNLEVTLVFFLKASKETVKRRICGRLIHEPSGRTYHKITRPPKVAGLDDVTHEPLSQRSDDKPEIVEQRIKVFNETVTDVLSYYDNLNILITLNADEEYNEVRADIEDLFYLANRYKSHDGN
ncbi:adenylate kinase-like [Dermatophagoides farinae]|uniref:adenylate kinase-like n=1 Tax=Dermatophagoides farinae TaxID=6954 RepID=UPI003F5FD716